MKRPKIIKIQELQNQHTKEFLEQEINSGKIFIYPTDTVYGLGCDATNDKAVNKIFEIKKRENKPLLIIAPTKNWIYENFIINQNHKKEIETKLPGPFSFIVKCRNNYDDLKNQNDFLKLKENQDNTKISQNLLCGKDTIGVRIPDAKFTNLISQINLPFITTSVNISGQPSALKIEDIPNEILEKVDYLIETEEKLLGKSSSIFDLTNDEIKQLR